MGWNDQKLLLLSQAVLEHAPDKWVALHMRARVLSAGVGGAPAWDASVPRTREDLLEAAMCFSRAAELAWTPARRRSLMRQASACVEKADTIGPLGTGCGLCC